MFATDVAQLGAHAALGFLFTWTTAAHSSDYSFFCGIAQRLVDVGERQRSDSDVSKTSEVGSRHLGFLTFGVMTRAILNGYRELVVGRCDSCQGETRGRAEEWTSRRDPGKCGLTNGQRDNGRAPDVNGGRGLGVER